MAVVTEGGHRPTSTGRLDRVLAGVDRAVRLVLLLVLLVAGLSVLVTGHPVTTQPDALSRELRAGGVTTVRFDPDADRVEWTVGRWHSYQADFEDQVADPGPGTGDGSDAESESTDHREQVRRMVAEAGPPLRVQYRDSDQAGAWTEQVRWERLRGWASLAWWLSLAMMLFRQRRTRANRWAWFWMFWIGGAGPLLYLLLEPEPWWRRPGSPGPSARRVQFITGATGFVVAVVMAGSVNILGQVLVLVLR